MDDKFYLVQVLSKDCEGIQRIERIGLYRSLKNAIDVANELTIRDYNAYDDAIVDEMWNDQVELTQELIDEILEQIADVDVRW